MKRAAVAALLIGVWGWALWLSNPFGLLDGDDGGPAAIADPPATASTVVGVDTGWRPLLEPGVGGRLTSIAIDPTDRQRVLLGGDLLGVGYSTDGGRTWTRATGLSSLEVSRFTHHPDRPTEVWVGTMGGPHVSFDGGRTWEPRRTGLPELSDSFYTAPVEVVQVDRDRPGRLLAFGGSHREWQSLGTPAWGAVWESVDGGDRWQRLATIGDGQVVTAAAQLDGGQWLASTTGGGVFRSDDDGVTWDPANDGLPHTNVRDLAAPAGGGGAVVYAALGEGPMVDARHLPGGIYRSDDGGRTWEARTSGLAQQGADSPELTSRYAAVAVSPVDPDTVWTADLAFGAEAVYRSDDGGGTWEVEPTGSGDGPVETAYSSPVTAEVLVADPDAAELAFAAQSEFVVRRTDDGTWVDATSRPVGDGHVGTGFSGLVATGVTFNPAVPGEIWLNALDGGQLIRSRDGGGTWDRPLVAWDPWGGAEAMAVAGDAGEHLYVLLGQFGSFNGIAVSDDGGETWEFRAGAEHGLPDRYQYLEQVIDVVADPTQPRTALASMGGTVYRSSDGGDTWTAILTGTFGPLAAGPDGSFYAADQAGVHVVDAGTGLATPLDGSPAEVDELTVDAASGDLYTVRWGADLGAGGGIDRWDGAAWSRLCLPPGSCDGELDRYARALAVDPFDPDHLVVVTNDLPFHDEVRSAGVFESTDRGATWTDMTDDLPLRRVAAVAFDPHQEGRVVVGTFGGGFYQLVS